MQQSLARLLVTQHGQRSGASAASGLAGHELSHSHALAPSALNACTSMVAQVGAQEVAMGVNFSASCTLDCTEFLEGVPAHLCSDSGDGSDGLLPYPKSSLPNAPSRDISFRLVKGDFKVGGRTRIRHGGKSGGHAAHVQGPGRPKCSAYPPMSSSCGLFVMAESATEHFVGFPNASDLWVTVSFPHLKALSSCARVGLPLACMPCAP